MEKNFELVSVENEGTLEIGSYELFLDSIKDYIASNKVFLIQDKGDLNRLFQVRLLLTA